MRLHFMLVRRVPPVPSPVLEEVYDLLRRDGFTVSGDIAEETVSRADEHRPRHDLTILKSHTELSLSLAGVLHLQGGRILNPYPSCAVTQNKIVTARVLRAAGVPAPRTWVTGDPALLTGLAAETPIIVKPYLGHRGAGIHILRAPEDAARIPIPAMPFVAQEYVEGTGEDVKLYVVGDEVFAVRKPFSPKSFSIPGRASPVTPALEEIARRTGRALGLGLYGLDVIEGPAGPVVVDVNYFPGYKGVPGAAARIARYIASYAKGEIRLEAPVVEPAEAAT